MARKFWRLIAMVPDTVAFDVMKMLAGRGVVESFVPAITGPDSEEGRPTSGIRPSEFVAQYIAENPRFKTQDMARAAVAAGLGKAATNAAVYALKNRGELVHVGPGEFAVKGTKVRGAPHVARSGRPSKKKPNGKDRVRQSRGAGADAVLQRLAKANGAGVSRADLAAAVEAAGGKVNSISGVLNRLQRDKKIKRAEKGHYVSA